MLDNDEKLRIDLEMPSLFRVGVMLATLEQNKKPTVSGGPEINQRAETMAFGVRTFLETLYGEDSEKLAESVGWPSADSLCEFIQTGRLPDEKAN